MAILDDLNGILTPEQIAQINSNTALMAKLDKKDELYSYYAPEDPPAAAAPPAALPPVVAPAAALASGGFDLSAIERMLDTKLGKVNELVESRVNEIVQARGDELVNNAASLAVRRADELNRIYIEHQANYAEAFDTVKFNEFLEANKDKRFSSIRAGYDAFIGPRATEREVDRRVTEKMKTSSGTAGVPGSTPAPSTNSNIRVFMNRNKTGDATVTTGAQKAAAALDKIMSRQNEMAS